MKCTLLTDENRKRIVQKVKPDKNRFSSFQYLNLLSGVTDEESGIILTRIYFKNEAAGKNGERYDDAGFIILGKEKCFSVFIREYYHGERYRYIKSPCPELISDEELLNMIMYYNSTFSERARIEKQSEEYQKAYTSFYRNFTDMYLNQGYFRLNEQNDGKNPVTRRRKKKKKPAVQEMPTEAQEEMSILVVILFAAAFFFFLFRVIGRMF
ncbi:MAG: hypothetical protein MJ095_08480 [Oscillospiraceae bacterium]|nr:hypothetical protein [Oscillospiraceae bacterium]